jgi:hypothetical protein
VPAADLPPDRAPHRLALVLVALLGLDIVLSWLALQAGLVFVNLLWHAAGGYQVRNLLEAHASQFAALRAVQLAAWLVTTAVLVAWLCRLPARRDGQGARRPEYAPRMGIMVVLGGLSGVAFAADLLARLLAFRSATPLDLGPTLQLLILGQAVAIAAAALGIAAILGVDRRHGEAARARGGSPRA